MNPSAPTLYAWGIDHAEPLCAGLVMAFAFRAPGTPQNFVPGSTVTTSFPGSARPFYTGSNLGGGFASDGSDRRFRVTLASSTSNFTIALRVIFRDTAILKAVFRSTGGSPIALYQWSDGRLSYWSAGGIRINGPTIVPGVPYHAVVRSSTLTNTSTLHINGVLQGIFGFNTTCGNILDFFGDAFAQHINGVIDHIAFWNRMLLDPEVARLSAHPRRIFKQRGLSAAILGDSPAVVVPTATPTIGGAKLIPDLRQLSGGRVVAGSGQVGGSKLIVSPGVIGGGKVIP